VETPRPPTAKRIAAARERLGITQDMMADRLGLSSMSYYDLEVDDDEAFMSLSLAQLRTLARILGVSARTLVSDTNAPSAETSVSMHELVARIQALVSAEHITADVFGERVGWDVSNALSNPESAWQEWCIDTLRDVSEAVGISWRAVLPDS